MNQVGDYKEAHPLIRLGVSCANQESSLLRRAVRRMTLPLFLTSLLVLLVKTVASQDGATTDNQVKTKPNFIFIITDDQDQHLDSVDYQPLLKKHIKDQGTTFKKHFCTVALCCPSRVSLLTGKAAHNTNVTDVSAPYGGYPKFVSEGHNRNYLPVWLQEAGYNTYYTGKLMNQHGIRTYQSPIAGGWTRSDFLLDPGTYRYLDSIMTLDSQTYRSMAGTYSTDNIAARSLEFLGNALDDDKPFFLGVAPIGPHGESSSKGFAAPIPADRHEDLFPDVKIPRKPNFNPDQPGSAHYLKKLPKLNDSQIEYNDNYYRRRLQALQAVDELVDGIVTKLEQYPKILANTYIIYTSDNGYHIGQHRLPPGKTCNIEEDINVPFLVRGPGIAAGKEVSFPTSHTDIVPTLFQLAGIPLKDDFDGVPMAFTVAAQQATTVKNEHVNIEFWGKGILEGTIYSSLKPLVRQNTYKTVRVVADEYDFMYAVWCTNEHQLFDMKTDPYQLNDLYGKEGTTSGFAISELTKRLDTLLLTLKSCKGQVCRQPWQAIFPPSTAPPPKLCKRDGDVRNLKDAMASRYNEFFAIQRNVSFSACADGYITEFEGALAPVPYKGKGMATVFKARWEDFV